MAAQSGLLQVGMEYVREKEPVVKMNSTSLSPGKDTVTGLRGALFLMEGGSNNSFDLLNFSEEETERDLATANNKNATTIPRGPVIVNTPSHHHSSNSNHHPHEEQFMVEIICKKFLQLFLVGVSFFFFFICSYRFRANVFLLFPLDELFKHEQCNSKAHSYGRKSIIDRLQSNKCYQGRLCMDFQCKVLVILFLCFLLNF